MKTGCAIKRLSVPKMNVKHCAEMVLIFLYSIWTDKEIGSTMIIKDNDAQFGGATFSSGGGASIKLWLSSHKKIDPLRKFIEENGRAKHVMKLTIDLAELGKFTLESQLKDAGEKLGMGAFVVLGLPDMDTIAPFESFGIRKPKSGSVEPGEELSISIASVGGATEEEQKSVREKKEVEEKGPYGHITQHLFRGYFFNNRKLYQLLGGDDDYLAWVRLQKSAVDGAFSEYINGEGRCEAAHFRSVADGAGMGYKPTYSAIPLTHAQHEVQHREGYAGVGGKDWFDKTALAHASRWAKERMCSAFNISSLSWLEPEEFMEWCATKDVLVPTGYVEAACAAGRSNHE